MSDRAIYAREVSHRPPAEVAGDLGRTVMLVVPGGLHYLTPAEAERLARQLLAACGRERQAGAIYVAPPASKNTGA